MSNIPGVFGTVRFEGEKYKNWRLVQFENFKQGTFFGGKKFRRLLDFENFKLAKVFLEKSKFLISSTVKIIPKRLLGT